MRYFDADPQAHTSFLFGGIGRHDSPGSIWPQWPSEEYGPLRGDANGLCLNRRLDRCDHPLWTKSKPSTSRKGKAKTRIKRCARKMGSFLPLVSPRAEYGNF